MKKLVSLLFLGMAMAWISAQPGVLESYVAEGLRNNLALKQKEAGYLKSLEQLKLARARFYPDISINARYTVAEGGRLIEFPVGTLLNDVYQTLNVLTGSSAFPVIENEEFAFYRAKEHETRIQLVQPIVDTRLIYTNRISRELSHAARADADASARQLVAEIKMAFFNYLKTVRLLELLDQTRPLLEENIRVNERLFGNEKITVDNVYRSRAELSGLDREYADALKSHKVARAWFNFLLNRPLESAIIKDFGIDALIYTEQIEGLTSRALGNREELQMLESYSRVAENALSMNRGNKLPNLYAAVDYGFQGTRYEFNREQDYMLASLVLRWDLFHGFEKRAMITEARIEQDLLQAQMEETEKKIRLQIIEAYYALLAAVESIKASEKELISAKSAFRVLERKYGEGQASLIEFIDARTSMTQSEQRLIINRYDYHIIFAELERVACLYNLDEPR